MESKIYMKPLHKEKKKLSSHKHSPASAVSDARPRQYSDRRRTRAVSALTENFNKQNKLNLGVGVRKMSVVIDRHLSFHFDISRFRKAVRSVISLLKILHLLRSRNNQLVKISLLRIMNLLQAPQNAGIMNDIGACEALLDLLNLDLSHHWQIVAMAMHGIKLLSLSPECSLTFVCHPSFPHLMERFIRSDSALTQKLAGEIVHNCFVQPVLHESQVIDDDSMMSLLAKALRLPYPEIQLKLLRLLEDLTYHCSNTARLCNYADSHSSGLVQILLELLSEGFNTDGDVKHYSLMILRNVMEATQTEPDVLRALLPYASALEFAVLKHLHTVNAFQVRHSFMYGNAITSPSNAASSTKTKRRSSTARRSSVKYMQNFVSAEIDMEVGLVEEATPAQSSLECLLRRVEQSDAMVEILWILRSSPVLQKVIKKPDVTPLERLNTFSAVVSK